MPTGSWSVLEQCRLPALMQRSGSRAGSVGVCRFTRPSRSWPAFAEPVTEPGRGAGLPGQGVRPRPDPGWLGQPRAPGRPGPRPTPGPGTAACSASRRRTAVYYASIRPAGTGLVRAVPGFEAPVVTYRLTRRDLDMLRSGLGRLLLPAACRGAEHGRAVLPRRAGGARRGRRGRRSAQGSAGTPR